MSAWIVSNDHIDVLVNALAASGTLPPDTDWRALGQELWHENHLSVNYRYDENTPTPTYVLRTSEAPLHPVAVLKAIGCFDYQSCEHEGWEDSRACQLLTALRTSLIESTGLAGDEDQEAAGRTRYWNHPVYNAAPWGFESLDEAFAIAYETVEV